jgi:hypothetical protein
MCKKLKNNGNKDVDGFYLFYSAADDKVEKGKSFDIKTKKKCIFYENDVVEIKNWYLEEIH